MIQYNQIQFKNEIFNKMMKTIVCTMVFIVLQNHSRTTFLKIFIKNQTEHTSGEVKPVRSKKNN